MRATLLLIALCSSMAAWAQARHIEVCVTDTLHLAPKSIVYRISHGPENTRFMGMPVPWDDEDAAEANAKPTDLDVVYLLIKKNKFAVEWEEPTDFRIGQRKGTAKALLVTVDSELHLRRLMALLENTEGIHGSVREVTHHPPGIRPDGFHQRVMERARADAQAIAQHSGVKLGAVLSVTEVPPASSNDYMDWMNVIMRMAMKEQDPGVTELRKEVSRTLLVRFEAAP